jgi:PTS system galactitol-specific IIA component
MDLEMLNKDLILLDLDCGSSDEVIRTLAGRFVEAGVVRESFVEAVAHRETVFPTALPAEIPIAIPHTASEHVITPAVGIAVLRHPVEFCQMGSPEVKLRPELIFMLAIKDPKAQIGLLRQMMKLIQNGELLRGIKEARDAGEVYDRFLAAMKGE